MALMTYSPAQLNGVLSQIGQGIQGKRGVSRIQAALNALQAGGLVADPNNLAQIQGALRMLPGPFGSGHPNQELGPFCDWCEQYAADFDPTGLPGGRFSGLGDGDPRREEEGREDCDLFGVIATDTASGSTGANVTSTIANTDTKYRKAVLWLWTAGGKARNITTLAVDNRTFYLGPSGSMPADICDVTLEPHPRRQGIYIGDVERSLSVTYFVETSGSTVHTEVLLDAAIGNLDKHRPGARILRRGSFAALG